MANFRDYISEDKASVTQIAKLVAPLEDYVEEILGNLELSKDDGNASTKKIFKEVDKVVDLFNVSIDKLKNTFRKIKPSDFQ